MDNGGYCLVSEGYGIARRYSEQYADSPGAFRLHPAISPSLGKFADAGCRDNRNDLLNPDGNFVVKSTDYLEGLFEKSFCSTNQVSLLLHS